MKKKRTLKRNEFVIGAILFIIIAIVIEVGLLTYSNKHQLNKSSQIILEQLDNIFLLNEQNEKETLAALKDDYVKRANTVAYILDQEEGAETSEEELKNIAAMMDIDEINLFDEKGVLFAGTHPEYFGYSFDSGEQIAFFKPMLSDKNLTMCQDMMPNTVLGKNMMYAIAWDKNGKYMVQVGIEPVRLIKVLEETKVHTVLDSIPVYNGMNIYVSDVDSGEILGATDKASVGNEIFSLGFAKKDSNYMKESNATVWKNGHVYYCNYKVHNDYLISVIYTSEANIETISTSIFIEIIWILVSVFVILFIFFRLVSVNEQLDDEIAILTSFSDIYYSMHVIRMSDFTIRPIESNERMDNVVKEGVNAQDMLQKIVDTTIEDDFKNVALSFVDLSTLNDRLKDKNTIYLDVIDKNVGWLRISFIVEEADIDNNVTKVIITTQVIDEDKKREEELETKANKDELTGLYNRRSYEDDVLNYPNVPPEVDFVYAAIDINGLKIVNDNFGHMAGDELIEGAAICLKRTFGNYGKVYRTGGDEFVAMFFADEERLAAIDRDLEQVTAEWEGILVDSLSLSVGYATKREFNVETVQEMSKIADERMYQAKAAHYAKKGVDRRGQAAAHTALCNLYTKILKINLTDDSFSIVNMDMTEQNSEKGYSNKISEWLKGFGLSGQVHEDDLKTYLQQTDIEYLRNYFNDEKTSISIFYRRKFADGFKQVLMEMIPADDYAADNQSLFLYVKSIDK